MFVVRPVETADIPALEALAAVAMPGVHTLPRTRAAIERTVDASLASFAAAVDMPSEESYCFVLQSLEDGRIAGAASISARAGSNGTFFAFRNDVIHQVSRDLGVSHSVHALTLCSDLTGYSQLSGFYVTNWSNAGPEAALLSRARLLFAAVAPHRFGDRFFASLPGVMQDDDSSPFWDALGRKFFQMDFMDAERLVEGARNRSLIVELMPHYPVYVPLLPGAAQAAMGQVHTEGELPFRILCDEGFEADEFIDIFDGGAIMQASRPALKTLSSSVMRRVVPATGREEAGDVPYLVSSVSETGFRAVLADCGRLDVAESVSLPERVRQALGIDEGDTVLCVRL